MNAEIFCAYVCDAPISLVVYIHSNKCIQDRASPTDYKSISYALKLSDSIFIFVIIRSMSQGY